MENIVLAHIMEGEITIIFLELLTYVEHRHLSTSLVAPLDHILKGIKHF